MKFCCPSECLSKSSKEFFLCSLRWSFGFWLLFVGLSKWINGATEFMGYIGQQFSDTFLPSILVEVTGWAILVMEPLCGVLLIIGFRPRLSWVLTAKLLFILMLGQTILGNYPTVADNWIYLLMALGAAALSDPECCGTSSDSSCE